MLDVLRLRRKYSGRIVGRKTELVVEGFPRSVNTFVRAVLLASPGGPRRIASHTHLPAQVFRALKFGVPVLILIRRPEEAAASLVLRNRGLSIPVWLRAYCTFYAAVSPLSRSIVVATFEQATGDLPAVIDRVNDKFGVALRVEADPATTQRAFGLIETWARAKGFGALQVALPTSAKAEAKEALLDQCRTGAARDWFKSAMGWYDAFRHVAISAS